jgi:protease I
MSKIAFLVDDMFEDSEFRVPYDRLRAAGHVVDIVGRDADRVVTGKRGKERVTIEKPARESTHEKYDVLVIPGGYSPDHLRMDEDAVRLTREMGEANKPVAAICHAPWMLIEAGLAHDRIVTSWPSLKTDLLNAGARWVDRDVVVDGNVITSRKPADLEAFVEAILHMLDAGVPERGEPAIEDDRPPTVH